MTTRPYLATAAAAAAALLVTGCGPRPPHADADPVPITPSDCSAAAGVPCREVEIPAHTCPEGTMDLLDAEVRLSTPDAVEVTGGAFQSYDVPLQELQLVVRAANGHITSVVSPYLMVTGAGSVFDIQVALGGRGLGGVDFYLFFTCDDAVYEMAF
ncbi:MAG TPA: hypothetical protein VG389_27240 [Myxococcota bacterium]|nr:hypothetical protein [Myxococcota bacterium]